MGSTDFIQWVSEGYLAGDPVRSALFPVVFLAVGAWSLLTGAPIVI